MRRGRTHAALQRVAARPTARLFERDEARATGKRNLPAPSAAAAAAASPRSSRQLTNSLVVLPVDGRIVSRPVDDNIMLVALRR